MPLFRVSYCDHQPFEIDAPDKRRAILEILTLPGITANGDYHIQACRSQEDGIKVSGTYQREITREIFANSPRDALREFLYCYELPEDLAPKSIAIKALSISNGNGEFRHHLPGLGAVAPPPEPGIWEFTEDPGEPVF